MNIEKTAQKALGVLIATAAFSALIALFVSPELFIEAQPAKQTNKAAPKTSSNPLVKLWAADYHKIDKQILPKEWQSIRKVRVFMLDKELHAFYKDLKSPIKTNLKGSHLLEVSFMSHHSEIDQKNKLIIQYNIIDTKTENMIWEHSRTLDLPKDFFDKKKSLSNFLLRLKKEVGVVLLSHRLPCNIIAASGLNC